jgi:uncharacterized Zn finger protein (UPF0148 family)
MAERCKRCGSPVLKDKVYGVRCPRGCHLDDPDSVDRTPPPSPKRQAAPRPRDTTPTQPDTVSARGGRRNGAGRPRADVEHERVTAVVPPALLQRLDAYATEHSLTRSGAVARLLDEGLPAAP